MLEFTAFSLRDPKKAAEMFTEDGAYEMPYLATFAYPAQCKGRDAIAQFFQFVRDLFPSFHFENVNVLIDIPTQAVGEYEFTVLSSKTGRPVHQLISGRFVAENGNIKLLRETMNTVELARGTVQGSAGLF